jgi:hypothetical protein
VDIETSIICQLKTECGQGYTNKLEGMVRDTLASEEFNRGNPVVVPTGVVWKCCIITTGVWPSSIVPWEMVKSPIPVRRGEEEFMKIFRKKFEKKSIKFIHSLTTCVVRMGRRGELVCSAAQGIVLMLFNDSDSMSMDVIVQETRIPEAEVKRAIVGLVESGVLSFGNDAFVSLASGEGEHGIRKHVCNEYQFKRIPDRMGGSSSHVSISEAERLQTESSVMEDRQHQLDALIVRIMKRLRTCSGRTLVREVYENFSIFSQTEICKRIDSLIDREFIEREPSTGDSIVSAGSLDDIQIKYLI